MNRLKNISIYLTVFLLCSGFGYGQDELKIGLLQMPSNPSLQWNLEKGEKYCREAKSLGADIALFPEMVSIGYHSVDFDEPEAMQKWKSMAINQK